MARTQRKRKLVEPRLQLEFCLLFLCITLCAVLVQTIVLNFTLAGLAGRVPHAGGRILAEIPRILGESLLLTLALLVPMALAIGVFSTFKIVGPIHRFKVFLEQVAAGERPRECRIRAGDELQDLCRLMNEATAPLRRTGNAAHDAVDPGQEAA
ncbi:MAG: methyl-accepting chemotaxis protein [Planctomycetota bacterium]|nr:MAG: methyl-accepting chemotaxis protein [Planctomycetota bacterium]